MRITSKGQVTIPVEIRDPQTGTIVRLKVIGVLSDQVPLAMAGITTSQDTLRAAFGDRVRPTVFYFDLASEREFQVTNAVGDQQLSDVSGSRIVYTDQSSLDVLVYSTETGLSTNVTPERTVSTTLPSSRICASPSIRTYIGPP